MKREHSEEKDEMISPKKTKAEVEVTLDDLKYVLV